MFDGEVDSPSIFLRTGKVDGCTSEAGARTWGLVQTVVRSLPIAAVMGLAAAAERLFAPDD
jgi:hypothetical protein